MAKLISIRTYNTRGRNNLPDLDWGSTSIVESAQDIPFEIKRVFYLYGSEGIKRGGHKHKKSINALICVHGQYDIFVNDGQTQQTYILKSPNDCLLLNNDDWHTMEGKTKDSVLLVLSSEHYDVNDYIDDEPS